MGFWFRFSRKYTPLKIPTNKQSTKAPQNKNKQKPKQSTSETTATRMHAGKGEGQTQWQQGKIKCADTLDLHVTTAIPEISAGPQTAWLKKLSILKIKTRCLISSPLPCSFSYPWKSAVEVIPSPTTTSLNLSERSLVQLSWSSLSEQLHRCPLHWPQVTTNTVVCLDTVTC